MFLESGFDGFISKPIDIRELNALLNRLIRDKQPPEVIEEARIKMEKNKQSSTALTAEKKQVSEELIKTILQDMEKALVVLDELLPGAVDWDSEDLNLYTTTIHGMKSVLLHINEPELSASALKLERAGDKKIIDEITADTPPFMNALRSIIKKHKSDAPDETDNISRKDTAFLKEKMSEIKTACENFKKKDAKAALEELKKKTWTHEVNELLDEISVNLLHGEFKKVVSAAERV